MRDPIELRVVIAAGGTGGHLFPGIAVAREFLVRHQAAVTFLTTPKAVTTLILERYGCAWEAVAARALKGEGLFSRGRTLLGVPGSVLGARARLKTLKPHLVLGMGGHASGPVGVAARFLGIPLALHEQNAIPGATNRYLSRLATKIFVSFPASREFFPPGRGIWTGNPIRPEFFEIFHKGEPRAVSPFTVLITGGSQGAHALNMAVLAGLPWLADLKDRLAFLHLTGEADREAVAAGYGEHGFTAEVTAFSQEMPDLMRRAHLLVCRAGASTLAELAAVGRAAILVPYPFAANNHQEFNARFFTAAGAAELILNKDFTGEAFAGKINQFLTEPEHLANLEAASRQLARPEAAKEIVEGCVDLIRAG
ncbi:MAG: undecaprenyldiphospho-muramoylpentapeptide beta-N-acetylglucosaminyltransferase [Desulfobacca sp. RBG_16_60_12]|nr:MAG: undecaprenyldiphospho-muramoylpentapeptide beta-N-acetylglucosaminyltransferase [Desulfobacca sp. RBG_16_60_12]